MAEWVIKRPTLDYSEMQIEAHGIGVGDTSVTFYNAAQEVVGVVVSMPGLVVTRRDALKS